MQRATVSTRDGISERWVSAAGVWARTPASVTPSCERARDGAFALAAEGCGPPAAASPACGRDTVALLDEDDGASGALLSSTANGLLAVVDLLAPMGTKATPCLAPGVTSRQMRSSSHCIAVT